MIIYDTLQQKIIHKNDVKGVNKPLALFLDDINNKIYYISSQSNIAKIFTINIKNNSNENNNSNNNSNLLVVKSYCLPVNGRVIHDININILKNGKFLVFTAGEDTKIKFYYIDFIQNIFDINKNNIKNYEKSILYLGDFNMHNCAVRKISFIKEINNEFFFCSIGAKKEIFLFKLNIDNISKPKFSCIVNLSENQYKPDKNIKKAKNEIEGNVENSRNMDLCLLNLENNKFKISITDTIDETTNIIFDLNNKDNNYNINLNKNSIKFTSSNFVPLCINYCTEKYLLYGQSNGVLRIYNIIDKKDIFFKLHEAGINEIKVFDMKNINKNIFLVFTCGEDCNLVISEFNLEKNEVNIINKIQNIHYSAIKSVDIIDFGKDLIVITGGYEQIINISLFNLENYIFKVLKTSYICTTEINSLKGILIKNEKNNDNYIYIVIGGLGMEYLKFKLEQ